jgi:hypothetical protein
MPTELPTTLSGAGAVETQIPPKRFTGDFYAVALFSGLGLLITVIAIACGVQGVWF